MQIVLGGAAGEEVSVSYLTVTSEPVSTATESSPYPTTAGRTFPTPQVTEELPFDRYVREIQDLRRRKRADYAPGEDPHANFRVVEEVLAVFRHRFGVRPEDEPYLHFILTKLTRILALRSKSTPPKNESLWDSFLDTAVYVLLWAERIEVDNSSGA